MQRIKFVSNNKGFTMQKLASKLGISRESLYNRLKNPTLKSLTEIAKALDCEVHELLETSDIFDHWYQTSDGQWLGIRKK